LRSIEVTVTLLKIQIYPIKVTEADMLNNIYQLCFPKFLSYG
jgi:hypothetical protein